MISGAMEFGVPHMVVRLSSAVSNFDASPRSPIFTSKVRLRNKFPSLGSRWITLLACMYNVPWINCILSKLRATWVLKLCVCFSDKNCGHLTIHHEEKILKDFTGKMGFLLSYWTFVTASCWAVSMAYIRLICWLLAWWCWWPFLIFLTSFTWFVRHFWVFR